MKSIPEKTLHRLSFYDTIHCSTVGETMNIIRKIKRSGAVVLSSAVAAAVLSGVLPALPASAADPKPLELVMDAVSTTPLTANNIKPGDSGTKTVQLTNTGTRDGFVSIFLTDVVSTEGDNPESETGDTAEPGELDSHFTLEFSGTGIETNLTLPLPVKNFPDSPTAVKYVKLIPLHSGETKSIDINWALPYGTNNDAQGDTLSFTINYMLRGANTIDISENTTTEGAVLADIIIYSQNEHGLLYITANTTAKTAANATPIDIWLIEDSSLPPPPPDNRAFAGLYYDAGPDGLVFDNPITITLAYDPAAIPAGVSELELFIALWDSTLNRWVRLPNCVVNTLAKTVSTQVTHFSNYTIMVPATAPPPTPPAAPPPSVTESDDEPELVEVELTIFDAESVAFVDDEGVLGETLVMRDEEGNVIIEIEAGAKITDAEGNPLSRIELTTVDIPLTLPDGTLILTPVYQLTGYDQDKNPTDIVFDPAAVISIRYNPDTLPDNTWVPFLAAYSLEKGLVPFTLPDGFLVDIGWAQGFITAGGLFLVGVEEAPEPPDLPASFRAYNLTIEPEQTMEGNPVRVSVTIANDGDETGTAEIYLIIDGVTRIIRQVTLAGKSSETMTFEVSNLAAGTHRIEIGHLTGTVKVVRPGLTPLNVGVNWLVLDLLIGGVVAAGFIFWFIFWRKARRKKNDREHAADSTS